MKRPFLAGVAVVAMGAAFAAGQTLRHHVEIKLPPSVSSERFFVRYVLTGQKLGEWVYAPPGVPSFGIATLVNGRPAQGMKAILYAPGCAVRTLDLKLPDDATIQYSFVCNPVRNVEVNGVLVRPDRLWQHTVKLQTRYTARWATQFLGLDETLPVSIVVGEMTGLSAEGRFRLAVPEFPQDSGEFEVWAKDEGTGAVVAKLVPDAPMRARMGGLAVRKEYPPDLTFTPCAASSARSHDKTGFAIRPDRSDACDPF